MSKRQFLSVVTAVMIATQLTGCTSASEKELMTMLQNGDYIEIEIEGETVAPKEVLTAINWIELASLKDQQDLRDVIDDQLMVVAFGEDSKNGVMYVNPENGNWEPNNTLENAYKNEKFMRYWDNVEKQAEIQNAVLETYCDVEEDDTAILKLAALNGYYNIFQDDEEKGYFNADSTLSRAQFMTGLVKASTQADSEAKASTELIEQLGESEYTVFAGYVESKGFLTTADQSLNESSFNGTMTVAEAVFMVVNQYYAEELANVDSKGSTYSDCKNGGNIAEKLEAKEGSQYLSLYELQSAINEGELPEELYKAMVVAKAHGLLGNVEESNWSEGITKLEALQMLDIVYRDLGTTCSYERGSGEDVEVADNAGGEQTVEMGEMSKEELGAHLGITGEELDVLYNTYTNEIEYTGSVKEALSWVENIIEENSKSIYAQTDTSSNENTDTSSNEEYVDNTSSETSVTETPEDNYTPPTDDGSDYSGGMTDEEFQQWLVAQGATDTSSWGEQVPLTEEQQERQTEFFENMKGY